MNTGDQNGAQSFADLAPERARRLLTLGLMMSSRPVDLVLDRLGETDAEHWVESTLDAAERSLARAVRGPLRAGEGGVSALVAIKDAAKGSLAKNGAEGQPASAILLYFLAVAAAQAHHGALISSRPAEEVAETLAELGAGLPEEWGRLCDDAASRMRE